MAQKSAHSYLNQVSSGIAWADAMAIFFPKWVWDVWFYQQEILILDKYVLMRPYISSFPIGYTSKSQNPCPQKSASWK